MAKQFQRMTVDSETFDLAEYNRLIEAVASRTASNWVGTPSWESGLGFGILPRPDVQRMLLIQVSAVTTVATAAVPVVPAYDWTEVVRSSGVYAAPGDGRSGTAATFPAFDTGMASNVPLNNGSTTSAYLAWLSWDERSLEFIGIDSTAANNGGSGVGAGFVGALVSSVGFQSTAGVTGNVQFDTVKYDTNGFFNPLAPDRLTIPAGVSGWFVFGATVYWSPVTKDNTAFIAVNFSDSLGNPLNVVSPTQGFNLKGSTGQPSYMNVTSPGCLMSPGDYAVVNFTESLIPPDAAPLLGYRGFWCYALVSTIP